MPFEIPFHQETFTPLCIKDNLIAERPVTFEISSVGGPGRARLKSMIKATMGLEDDGKGTWTEENQDSVIACFKGGNVVFTEGVTRITQLTVPAKLARKVGLKPARDETEAVAITTGEEFSLVCDYMPILAFEVAMAIAKVSEQGEIDPRFFGWFFTLPGMPVMPPGTAVRARKRRERSATAGSRTSTAATAPATS